MTSPRLFALSAVVALAALAAACDPVPTAPRARLTPDVATIDPSTQVLGVDLGVLPGDRSSRAVWITEEGTVYGYSYAVDYDAYRCPLIAGCVEPTRHPFRWTAAGGIQAVSSIPAKPAFPIPSGAPAGAGAANAKGEVAGPDDLDDLVPPWRWSRGAGRRVIDPLWYLDPEAAGYGTGVAINRWGHVAGAHFRFEVRTYLWTPLDSFGDRIAGEASAERRFITLNDNDQVTLLSCCAPSAALWRPDIGYRSLVNFDGIINDDRPTFAVAQNNRNQVVGWGNVNEQGTAHATIWNAPPPNRASFPAVNASPISYTSTISLAATGGRYFLIYRATQSTAAGPYVHHVDWGDGRASRHTRSTAGGLLYVDHVYTKTGTFWVRVYVKDAQGRWGVAERRVTVTA